MLNLGALSLSLVVAAASVPAPALSPSPNPASPADAPLREIYHARATTPLCHALIDKAALAVNVVLDNDYKFVVFAHTLRTTDFDSNAMSKYQGTMELTKQYAALRSSAVLAMKTMEKFRDDAKTAPTDDQKKALLTFADALEGAANRQKKLADDLSRFIVKTDTRPPETDMEHDEELTELLRYQSNFHERVPGNPLTDILPNTPSTDAKHAADELEVRTLPIQSDEQNAADRMDNAFKDC